MGKRVNKFGETVKKPTTKAEYREQIISMMVTGLRSAHQLIALGDSVRYGAVPQTGLYHRLGTCPARMWKTAQDMEKEGLLKIASGSWESGEVVVIAGENWRD